MDLFLIYLWLKLDGLRLFLVVSSSGLIIITLVMLFCRIDNDWDTDSTKWDKKWIKHHNQLMLASMVGIVLALLSPTSKDVAILVGSSIALDVAKSPEGTKVASLLRGKANELLDAELQKLTSKKGK